jgi:hypothetical protein
MAATLLPWRPFRFSRLFGLPYILIGGTGATEEFKFLTVRKRKACAVSAGGWRIVSGAEIVPGESVTIVVDH